MGGEIIVLVTCPADQADGIARPLIEEGLAACVNMVPGLKSVFLWKGAIETQSEELLVIKTSRRLFADLQKRVRELHSYDTPEIVSLAIEDGYKPYLDWLNSALRQ